MPQYILDLPLLFLHSFSSTKYPSGVAYSPVIPFKYPGISSLHRKKDASWTMHIPKTFSYQIFYFLMFFFSLNESQYYFFPFLLCPFLKIKTDNPNFSVSELTALRLKRLALILLFHFFYYFI